MKLTGDMEAHRPLGCTLPLRGRKLQELCLWGRSGTLCTRPGERREGVQCHTWPGGHRERDELLLQTATSGGRQGEQVSPGLQMECADTLGSQAATGPGAREPATENPSAGSLSITNSQYWLSVTLSCLALGRHRCSFTEPTGLFF